MIVVVEGIDRVGKTTFCNALKEKFGEKVVIFKDEMAEFLREERKNKQMLMAASSMNTIINFHNQFLQDKVLVLDRFHTTEYVYGVVERGVKKKKAKRIMMSIESELNKLDGDYRYIYMRPMSLKRSSEEHGGDLTRHYEMFEDVYGKLDCRRMVVNYNTMLLAGLEVERMVNIHEGRV